MNASKLKWILYFIAFVILCTIGVQVYWNYKNYQANKRQLINDVQLSLDNAVESYFANLAKTKTLAFAFKSNLGESELNPKSLMDSLVHEIRIGSTDQMKPDSLKANGSNHIKHLKIERFDMQNDTLSHKWESDNIIVKEIEKEHRRDSLGIIDFSMLTSKVLVSLAADTLRLEKIDSLLKNDLQSKDLDIRYNLEFEVPDKNVQYMKHTDLEKTPITLSSKSNYLPLDSNLTMHFTNETIIILKRILLSILISTLLIVAVISSLFYLLRIIRHQRQLSEVKNDLISNITHEFKTPIATIGVALESISRFNVIEDKAKTKSYVDMSATQLNKLNVMVEKLLETATLDSDTLELNKEFLDVANLIDSLVQRYKTQHPEKTLILNTGMDELTVQADPFHIENALNNILDNAIKYGGDTIAIDLGTDNQNCQIIISDSGNTLKKEHKDKIFEKFYRVPKGNTHDVKGYGIGLYYTKTIIEKHDGAIEIALNNDKTSFKISLPNG
ncbi:sensor histidine kinase [Aestuariivivens sediminicola]|uniref:sensor histidine kinase n=1 Tax=Aestuariivivens sediminicola TaxID=2913560 RepID=UPI001F57389B|nr:HAMP domain-containing sensor histidine kinase [Aestuariivivens sediminicola]